MINSLEESYLNNNLLDLSVSTGLSGKLWFYNYLYLNKYISVRDKNFLCSDKHFLYDSLHATNKDFDYLHGNAGIVNALVYLEDKNSINHIRSYLSRIEKELLIIDDAYCENILNFSQEINIGLAHGLVAVLKNSIEMFNKNIFKKLNFNISYLIINILIKSIRDNKQSSFSYLIGNEKEYLESRLGWCYGDLSTAYVLLLASITFKDDELKNRALVILYNTCKRKTYSSTLVMDASICHGSAGISLIYKKLWDLLKSIEFKNSMNYWMNVTIEYSCNDEVISGYLYHKSNNVYSQNISLLEGISGIGLLLNNSTNNNISHWDSCLLLN